MKKKTFFTLWMIAFICFQHGVYAQRGNETKFRNVEFEHDEKNVSVKMILNLQSYYIESGDSLTLTPLIKSKTNVFPLSTVTLIGRGKQGYLLSNGIAGADGGMQIPDLKQQSTVLYQSIIPYETWMANSVLDIMIELNQIGGSQKYAYLEPVREGIGSQPGVQSQYQSQAQPRVYSEPRAQSQMQVQQIQVQSQQELTYQSQPQSRTYAGSNQVPADLPLEYAGISTPKTATATYTGTVAASNSVAADVSRGEKIFELRLPSKKAMTAANPAEIEDIRNFIRQIIKDDKKTLTSIYITAYTSVDGIYYDNDVLTMKQANAFRDQIMRGLDCPASYFFADWRGEDWPGLEHAVMQTELFHKDAILNIINNTGIFTGRERELMILDQGYPYRYIKENLFPQQWRVECKVMYISK